MRKLHQLTTKYKKFFFVIEGKVAELEWHWLPFIPDVTSIFFDLACTSKLRGCFYYFIFCLHAKRINCNHTSHFTCIKMQLLAILIFIVFFCVAKYFPIFPLFCTLSIINKMFSNPRLHWSFGIFFLFIENVIVVVGF